MTHKETTHNFKLKTKQTVKHIYNCKKIDERAPWTKEYLHIQFKERVVRLC